MSSNNLYRNRGKRLESYYANRYNCKREGILGGEDVSHPVYSIETKERKDRTSAEKFMEQAERNSNGKVPLVIIHRLHQSHDEDLFVFRRKDIEKFIDFINDGE